MDVWRITIAALRRWYILLPLLALTGVAVAMSGNRADPEYEAQASAMVVPGPTPAEIHNPYGNVAGAQQALSIILTSSETRRDLADQGLSWDYEVGAEARSTIFQILVRADSPSVARDTATEIIEVASDELEARQEEAGLDEESSYTIDVLSEPAVLGTVESSQLRTQAVVGALGTALAIVIAVLFDDIVGFVRRARARRRRPDAVESPEDTGQLSLDDIDLDGNGARADGDRAREDQPASVFSVPQSAPTTDAGDPARPTGASTRTRARFKRSSATGSILADPGPGTATSDAGDVDQHPSGSAGAAPPAGSPGDANAAPEAGPTHGDANGQGPQVRRRQSTPGS